MPNAKNTAIVEKLREKLSRAKSVILADYRGLTHKQSEELKRAVKKAGGEFVVAKNSLLRIASSSSRYPLDASRLPLVGPTAALVAYDDELAPLKELAKTSKNLGLPKIKLGFIGQTPYSDTELDSIAKLPAKEVLQAQVVNRLQGPLFNLVYDLNHNLQRLAYTLNSIKTNQTNPQPQ